MPFAPKADNWSLVNVPDGQGGMIQKEHNAQTGQFRDPQYGGQQAPAGQAGGGGNYPVLDDAFTNAVMQTESGGDPNAVSSAGARGLMQIMPDTARDPGFGVKPMQDGSPQENVRVGKDYLNAMLHKYGGNQMLALAAYNGGPGRVDAALQKAGGDPQQAMQYLPAETQAYPGKVQSKIGGAQQGGRLGYTPPKRNEPTIPSGYMWNSDHTALQAIPGGPSDPGGGASSQIGDQTKTGSDYLATLDQSQAKMVKALADGRMQFPTGTALKTPYWQQPVSAVQSYDPSAEAGSCTTRVATRKAFTSGKQANQINARNTTAGHLIRLQMQPRRWITQAFPPTTP